VLRGTVATVGSNVWAVVIGLVSLPLLLGGLGATGFGAWVLLQTLSVTSGWLSLGDFGLTTSITRSVSMARAADEGPRSIRIAVTGLAGMGALGLVWAVVVAAIGPLLLPSLFRIPERLESSFKVAVLWFALQILVDFGIAGITSVLEGGQRVDTSRLLDVVRRTLAVGSASVVALTSGDLGATSAASALGTGVALLVAAISVIRLRFVGVVRPRWSDGVDLLRYGWRVAPLRPIGVLRRTMDRLIVGAVLGPGPVALVEIATQFQNAPEAAVSGAAYAVTPSAAWVQARGDDDRLKELVGTGTRYSLLVTLPVIAATALLAGPALTVWLGADHLDALPLIYLGLAYSAVSAPLQVGSNLLVGTGHVGAVVRAAGVGLALNLVLSLALVGPLGPEGVFLATLVSTAVTIPILTRAFLPLVHMDLATFNREAVLPPFRAVALMAIVVAPVVALPLAAWPTLVLGGVVGALTYAVGAIRWGLGPGELRSLLGGLRRSDQPALA
jgi:PST family polysaccharide transporter